MKSYEGILPTDIMYRFPRREPPAGYSFGDWVANHVGLEQVLGLAGFLAPEFVEVDGFVFWDRRLGTEFEKRGRRGTRFGDDPQTIERAWNSFSLGEFFLPSASEPIDVALDDDGLLRAFGLVIQHFWSIALERHFPDRVYEFEIGQDLFDEEGLCLTFWRVRD